MAGPSNYNSLDFLPIDGEGVIVMRRQSLIWVFVAIPTLSVGFACKPEAKVDSSWTVYEVPADGFALELPPNWLQVDVDPKTIEARSKYILQQNPQLESVLGNLRQQVESGAKFKFWAVDGATDKPGIANVNVMRYQWPGGRTLDSAVEEAIRAGELMTGFEKPIAHERLKMATGDRERLRYRMTMKLPNGQSATGVNTQFILVKDDDRYAVTFTTSPDLEAKYSSIFDKIGRSFRFIE